MGIRAKAFRSIAFILGAVFFVTGVFIVAQKGFIASGVVVMGLYFLFYSLTGYSSISGFLHRNTRNDLV